MSGWPAMATMVAAMVGQSLVISLRDALQRFARVQADTLADALRKAQELGITVPQGQED